MAGLRHTYVTILGVILISYGIILNVLGAIASFIHPGSYHHGAVGTPMWGGLAYIILGAVNAVKGLKRNKEKGGISLLLSTTNFLAAIVSFVVIALTSWSMSASGIITDNSVTELTVTSQTNATNDNLTGLQLSLTPIYSTVISSCVIIILMVFISLFLDCVRIIYARPAITAQVHHGKGWDERDGPGKAYPIIEEEATPQYHHGDAVGEVVYGNSPPLPRVQVVKTIERPSFHYHMEPITEDNRVAIPYHAHHPSHAHHPEHAHYPDHVRQPSYERSKKRQTITTHQPHTIERENRNRKYPYQSNPGPEVREVAEREDRRPKPYFYL
ncbi:uncharacterized protein LOC121417083 [Lytechinus variegatus]|uniref:uncharacterized protein LOC121417083 n=1 Tax=Lytechinus variegatus TaxID=7654 RepID=UPI001BB28479|nr:uncharacterized protein LOC121417083 [Lytechinus variegatus]